MKRQSTSSLVVPSNFRRLLLPCMVALVLLALVRPGLALDVPEGKTPEVTKASVAAMANSGLGYGTAELPILRSSDSCPFIKCWISCDNGQSHTQYFTTAFACYSYSNESCHAAGFFVCSERSGDAGC